MKLFQILFLNLISCFLSSQQKQPDLPIRNIGPASPGGRITDVEANPDDFTKVYVAVSYTHLDVYKRQVMR